MSKWVKIGVVSFITVLLGVLVVVSPTGRYLEESVGLPLLFHLRGARPAAQDVLVVTIDESSRVGLGGMAQGRQWDRSLYTRIIDRLREEGAAVIVFDVVFEKAYAPENDQALAAAIGRAGNVVLCEALRTQALPLAGVKQRSSAEVFIQHTVRPLPIFVEAAAATAPFPLPKVPVRVSRYWIFTSNGGDKPTLPIVAFHLYVLKAYETFLGLLAEFGPELARTLPGDRDTLLAVMGVEQWAAALRVTFARQPQLVPRMVNELRRGSGQALSDEVRRLLVSLLRMYQSGNSQFLNFYGPPGTLATISHERLLQPRGECAAENCLPDLHGKAVFVGLSELSRPEQRDGFHTVYSQANGIDLSGVEIAATAFANLIEDNPVRWLGLGPGILVVTVWGILLALMSRLLPTIIAGLAVLLMGVGYTLLVRFQFAQSALWFPLIAPLVLQAPAAFLVTIGWKYFEVHRERQHIRRVFGYYLPDSVVDQLAHDQAAIHHGPQMVYGACLYTDAARFTHLGESMAPIELNRFMNRYYETVFRPVRDNGGMVSDIVGDSMLAVWTADEPDRILRRRACLAALGIARALRCFGAAPTGQVLQTRIGLHCGHMSLGNIGGMDRYEYRAVGDVINTTTRLEGLNKYLGTQILATVDVVSDLDGFHTREIGAFVLAGKSQPVLVHEIMGRSDEVQDRERELSARFVEALTAYRGRAWDEAVRLFQDCDRMVDGDGPSRYYLDWCELYRRQPPDEAWDGVIVLDRK